MYRRRGGTVAPAAKCRGRGEFVRAQRLPGDGAHGAELFEAGGTAWLAVANFGDRLGKRYAAESTVSLAPEADAAAPAPAADAMETEGTGA